LLLLTFRFPQDENSYYIKSTLGLVIHQFHPHRDHLCAST
jgi:hypothetical protein